MRKAVEYAAWHKKYAPISLAQTVTFVACDHRLEPTELSDIKLDTGRTKKNVA